jgi:hypothetical protein
MRAMGERRAPGVEDGGEADARAGSAAMVIRVSAAVLNRRS